MNYTTNYNLKLPEKSDLIDIADFNYNATAIDAKLKDLSDDTAALPTIQTAVADNSTAITNLQTRVGEAESDISANTTEINGVKTVNEAQWSAINTNGTNIATANNKIAALEKLEGDILFNQVGDNWTLNPPMHKKLTAVGHPLKDMNNIVHFVIPSTYLPSSYIGFFVNASIFVRSGAETYLPYTFNQAFINTSGDLEIIFKPVDPDNQSLPTPVANWGSLMCYAEILFI